MQHTIKIFDLHCDTLTTAEKDSLDLNDASLHLSLSKIPERVRLCQCMAIFMPDNYRGEAAESYFDKVCRYYDSQREKFVNLVHMVDPAQIDSVLERGAVASVLTVEGGSVLAAKLENIYKLRERDVKMMTLTWNGANEICGGAATQEGFSDFGRKAVGLMEELGIVVDVSHLSDVGFWELCDFAERPFVASHSNSRAVCDHRRNLTDDMFCQIRDRGGLVGLNYFKNFIDEKGETASMEDLIRHAHHFLELQGEDVIALGSDFDGAAMPPYIAGVQSAELLHQAFLDSGIPGNIVDKIFFENANRFFKNLQQNQ